MTTDLVTWTPLEVATINRMRLALKLCKLPHEIDTMPINDVETLIAVLSADERSAQEKAKPRGH